MKTMIWPFEIVMTFVSLGWAYVMFREVNMFEEQSSRWLVLDATIQEWGVGLITLSLALIKIYGFVLKSNRCRKIGLTLSGVWWSMICAAITMGDGAFSISTGSVAYAGYAVLCFLTSSSIKEGEKVANSNKRGVS
ncbi:hypothetical protein ACQKM1_22235 [Peribacillus frigoritolerans]|uniref:hypothetical protein n=1 Tax=Peribacillus frigoritolerans TaxID=450367 RepID=UPI003D0693B8